MAHRSAGYILVAAAILLSICPQSARGQGLSSPSGAPAPSTASAVTVDTLFPRLPGSFTNKANNAFVDWNIATQWVMRNASDTNVAVRTLALVSLGIWNSIQYNNLQPEPANETAVVGYAAHLVLMNLYPRYFSQYDQLFAIETQGLSDAELDYAESIASPQVVQLLASRLNDGSQSSGIIPPRTAPPGVFRSVSGSGSYRAFSQFSVTLPFCITHNDSQSIKENFERPYVYPSDAYDAEYTAVYLLGGANSTTRSAIQTQTAYFWSDAGTGVAAHWDQLALATLPANATIQDTAELMTLLNLVIFDSVVTGYAIKYNFDFWRPFSAISLGDDNHSPDVNWTSLLPTPNNPASPSTQSALAGGAEIVLQHFYGTDRHPFTLGSEYSNNGTSLSPRTYTTFSGAVTELIESRFLGGTEYKADSQAGRLLGREIAELCLERFAGLGPSL